VRPDALPAREITAKAGNNDGTNRIPRRINAALSASLLEPMPQMAILIIVSSRVDCKVEQKERKNFWVGNGPKTDRNAGKR
jgi:hypothetical protein